MAALPLAAQGGAATAFLAAYDSKRDAAVKYRAVAVAADASLTLVQQGEVVWAREEALGHVRIAHFAELPPVKIKVGEEPPEDVWVRVQRQLRFQVRIERARQRGVGRVALSASQKFLQRKWAGQQCFRRWYRVFSTVPFPRSRCFHPQLVS